MRASTVASWVLVAASPLVLYVALSRARVLEAALLILAFAALKALPAFVQARRAQRIAALRLPAVAAGSALAGLVTGEPRMLLLLPSLSQLAFAGVFLGSLRGTPLVEHFARMQKPELRPEQVRYCRTVTWVWGIVLTVAAVAGLALAAWAPLAVWTAFTAVGSYVLVGVVSTVEWLVRKIRFREYGSWPLDRLLASIFPPPASPPADAPDVRELILTLGAERDAVVRVPPEYVFFRGHFDDVPMLPGVVQLTEIVVPLARRLHPDLGALRQLRRVRFRRPVLPGETVTVRMGERTTLATAEGGSELTFDVRMGSVPVASGTLAFAQAVET